MIQTIYQILDTNKKPIPYVGVKILTTEGTVWSNVGTDINGRFVAQYEPNKTYSVTFHKYGFIDYSFILQTPSESFISEDIILLRMGDNDYDNSSSKKKKSDPLPYIIFGVAAVGLLIALGVFKARG